MLENLHVLISVDKVENFSIVSYPLLSKMPGEFLIIHKNNSSFYFLCSNNFDIESICRTFDWYIVSKNRFNNQLIIGIGLTDKEYIDSEAYRILDKKTLKLWRDILYFTFENNFVCKFSPYDNHFIGECRLDGSSCFYIHDYYPVVHYNNITFYQKKVSNLIFRFKEGKSTLLAVRIFSLAISRMPFFKKAKRTILIPIPASTRERNQLRFARFCFQLSKKLKMDDGYRAVWIKQDREQLKGKHCQDKLSNLVFFSEYFIGKDVFLIDDVLTTGQSFIQMKRRLIELGANSVTGLFLGRTKFYSKGK
jgi:predicted amidophosphoribosyltransferase